MLYPEQKPCSIDELEKKLAYRHIPLIEFESAKERKAVRLKGLRQEKKGEILSSVRQLGQKYYPQILRSYIPEVSIRWVHASVGYGLFAEQPIIKHHYVGEYTGIIRKNDRRYFEPLNNYCYEYPVADEIGRNYVIDATAGCLTRFINHSSDPNLKPLYAYWKGYFHLIFLSLRKIVKGEQFSYDYGENYWYLRKKPVSLKGNMY